MSKIEKNLYTAAQVRALDRTAIDEFAIPGISLMKRAGRGAFDALLTRWPNPEKITVYCGSGNNGGDGYVIAALAAAQKLPAEVIQAASPEKLVGDARRAYEYALAEGVAMTPMAAAQMPEKGVVVDALLGTGLRGAVKAPFSSAIASINDSGLPVLAVDIPSGLCADTGSILGSAVRAQVTATFIGSKRGLYTGAAPACCGDIVYESLHVPEEIFAAVDCQSVRLDWTDLATRLPQRAADAHKGLYGHVMIIGGELGYGGAVAMAAEAALRVGAGLVSVATRPQHVNAIIARCPEVMATGVASGQELEPLLSRPTVLVVGPGLGRTPWSEQMLQKALAAGLPMVLDADALNILSEGRVGATADISRSVLTPHPGEAARLLNVSTGEIQRDRFNAVADISKKYSATVLLKGAGTLIASVDSPVLLCPYGNPGMAAGGMGDVLSGVIGSLIAQGLSLPEAASLGACLHSLAADDAAVNCGQIGLCATDLMPWLRARRNQGKG